MVEALYSMVPALPSVSAEVQGWLVAAIVFAMVFAPLWRFAKSLCAGWDRIHAPKPAKRLESPVGYQNKIGRN